MSLVEMMVAIGIFSLGISGFSILFAKSWQMNSYIYETGQDSFIASRAVDLVVNDLRKISQGENGDYAIKSASEFDLVVYIDIDDDNRSEKVHYFLDQNSDQLKMGVSQPTGNPTTYSSGDDSVSILSSHIVNDSSRPVFSYFGNNYITDQTPFNVPISSQQINLIRLIKVDLWVDIRPYQSPDHITVESFAQLRNLR